MDSVTGEVPEEYMEDGDILLALKFSDDELLPEHRKKDKEHD